MKYNFKFGVGAFVAAMCLAGAVNAAQPISGVSAGGGHPTIGTDVNGQLCEDGVWCSQFDWRSAATVSLTDGTSTAVKVASATGLKHCTTMLVVSPVAATTAVTFTLRDGATALFTYNILAGGDTKTFKFTHALCGTANTAVNAILSGAPTGAVSVWAEGYDTP